ncbi:MAG: hypothetical protein AAFN79_07705 [Pseudomonadota bacterium]
MTGVFKPTSFDADQVQRLTDTTSAGTLSSFSALPREDGLTDFSVSCDSWRRGAGLVQYERTEGSTVLVKMIGGNGLGNVITSEYRVEL